MGRGRKAEKLKIPGMKGPGGGSLKLQPILIVGTQSDGKVVTLIKEIPEHPGEVGLLLADIARHWGNAFEQAGVASRAEVVQIIKMYMDREFGRPTDPVLGAILPDLDS